MSTEVDRKVVELSFDNSKFEKNIKKSQQSLNQFKSDLDFKDSVKSIDVLKSAIESITLKPLENSIVTVRESFNLLYRTVDNVMDRIASKIVDTGKKYAEMFTVAPITAGFQEYETQMGAIQTILANTSSKGSTLDDVNKSLNELNKYADLTIYNFTEMTRNIGTFTAAGIDLETSTRAIQGIANLAAVSGSTSQQASTAMYQLSQALAAGALKLQDWNSVVNAGMGGEVFQNALKETAKTYGVAVDKIIEKAGSFRESLKEGWITSEILTETLSKFTTSGVNEYLAKVTGTSLQTVEAMRKNALASSDVTEQYHKMAAELAKSGKISEDQAYQLLNMSTTAEDAATKVKTFSQLIDTLTEAVGSGWTTTWQLIVGDFEEAKGFFTDISDMLSGVINDASDARNAIVNDAMTSNWSKFSSTLQDAGLSVDTFRQKLIDDARKSGLAIDKWMEIDGSFEATLRRGWLTDDRILNTLDGFAGKLDGTGTEAAAAAQKIASYQSVVNDVIQGVYGNGAARVKALTDAGYEYSVIQDLVNRTIAGEKINYDELSDAQLKSLGLTDDQIQAYKALAEEAHKSGTSLNEMIQNMSEPSGRQLLIESIKNTLTGILAIANSVKIAFKKTFSTGAKPIKSFLTSLYKLTEAFANVGYYTNELIRTFSGLFSLFGIVGDIAGGILKFALQELGKVVNIDAGNILGFTASIGDNIVAFRKWMKENNVIQTSLEKIRDAIANAWTYLGEFKDRIMETEIAQTVFAKIQTGAKNVGKFMNEHFGNAITLIKNFIQYVKSLGHIDLSDLPSLFASFREMVVDELFKMEVDFTDFGTYLKTNLISSLQSSLAKVRGPLDNFLSEASIIVDAIKKTFSQLNWGVVFSAVNAFAVIKTVDKITNALTNAASSFEPVTGILKSVKGAIGAFSNVLKQQAFKTQAEAVLELAAGVGILALSLTLLASIDSDKILKATGLLAEMVIAMGAVGLISVGLSKLSGDKVINTAPLTILAIAGALIIMVDAFEKLSAVIDNTKNWTTLSSSLEAMMVIMLSFAGSVTLIGLVSKNLGKASIFVLALAISFKSLLNAVMELSNVKALPAGVALQITGFLLALGLIAKACDENTLGIALSVLAMSAAIRLLVGAFNAFPDASSSRKWFKSLVSLIAVTAAMSSLLKVISKDVSQYAWQAGAAALGMSLAISALAAGIGLIGTLKASTILKGLVVVSAFGAVASALIAVSKYAGEHAAKAGIMLLAFAGSVVALTAAVAAFSLMDTEGLIKGVAAITAIGGIMSLLLAVSKRAENAQKSIIYIGLVLSGMVVALGILGSDLFDQNKLIKAAEALGLTMVALGVSFTSIVNSANKIANGDVGNTLKKIGVMVATLTAISGVMVAVEAIQKYAGTESSIATIAGISALMLVIGPAFKNIVHACDNVQTNVGKMTVGLLAMTGVVGLISGLVLGIDAISKKFDLQTSLSTIGGISVMLIAVAAALDVMAVGGLMGMQATMTGILSTITLITALYAVVLLIGSLQEALDSDYTGLQAGLQVLSDLFVGLGQILSDSVVASLSGLPAIGTLLSDFMTNVMGFLDDCDDITIDKIEAVSNLVDMFKTLFDGTYKIKSVKKNKESMDNLKDNLGPFTEIVTDFSDKAKTIDASGLKNAVDATTAMAQIADLLANDIWAFEALTDSNNSLTTFSTGLSEYGTALVDFSVACNGLSRFGMNKAVAASDQLAEVNGAIPNSGGIWAGIVGDNTWTTFGAGLSEYGTALMTFAKKGDYISVDGMKKATDATESLGKANEKIPNSGGIWAGLAGDNTWTTFKEGLNEYGISLVTFSTICNSISVDGMKKGKDATEDLATVNSKIPESGGALGALFGDTTWATFSQGLSSYATALQSFSIKSKLIDATSMQNGIDATDKLIELSDALPEDPNALFEFFTGTLDWSVLSTGLVDYGTALKSFSDTMSVGTMNFSSVNAAITTMSKFIQLQDAIKKYGLNKNNVDWSIVGTNLDGLNGAFTYVTGVTEDQVASLGNMSSASEKLVAVIKNVSEGVVSIGSTTAVDDFKKMLNAITVAAGNFYIKMGKISSSSLDSYIAMINALVYMINNTASIDTSSIQKYADVLSVFQSLSGKTSVLGDDESQKSSKRRFKRALKAKQNQANEAIKTTRKITRDITNETETQTAEVTASTAKAAAETEKEGKITWDGIKDTVSGYASSFAGSTKDFFTGIISGDTSSIASMFGLDGITSLFSGNLSIAQSDITEYYKNLGIEYSSTLQTAKSEYDAIIEDYKEGRITQSEYDAKYTSLLKKYTQDQVGLIDYAQGKMSDYVQKNMDNLNKDFENTIKTIQSKIDKLKGNVTKDMAELMTFTTKNDLYEQGLEPLETRLQELNDQKDAAIEKYGKESNQVVQLEKSIKSLEKEIEVYKKANESAKGDDTVVDAKFTNKIRNGTTALNEYIAKLKELQKRSGSDALMSLFEGMDVEKGTATANYLLSETDEELAALAHNYEKYQNAGNELAKTLYGDQLQSATEAYVKNVLDTVNELPDSAKTIGVNIAAGLANGFSDETEASLSLIDMSGAKITDSLKELFGIHSPSTVMRDEVGRYLAQGLIEGFIDELNKFANGIGNYVSTDLGILDVNTQTSIDMMNNIVSKLNAAIQNGINTSPVITPVLDLSQVQLGMGQLNTMFGAGGLTVPNTLINSTANINANDAALLGAVTQMNTDICGKLDTINPINELMQLRNDVNVQFTTINDRLDNMQVVMDTGALVGQLTSGIDQSLGDRATMKRRGG